MWGRTFGGGREPIDWPEIRRAFNRIISDQSKYFFFLVDGLDEFDGESKEIIDLIFGAVRPNVRLCVSSRAWLPFEDAFKGRPSLLLEELTKEDISTFVNEHFENDGGFLRLRSNEPAASAALLDNIVERAFGVFLWVHLVVQSLLEGFSNSDRIADLQTRLDALPGDLQVLITRMLCACSQSTLSKHVKHSDCSAHTGRCLVPMTFQYPPYSHCTLRMMRT
jgi:hypothetical protein